MLHSIRIAVLGACALCPLALAGQASAQPRSLTAGEMDAVTAGTTLDLLTQAIASGNLYAVSQTNIGAATSYVPIDGGGFVESGVAGGTSSAVSDTGNVATSVATSGTTNGFPLVNVTAGGTLTSPVGQASVSFTYVSGGTYFLP
jgi:hypothetical protein